MMIIPTTASTPTSPNAAHFGASDVGWQALGPAIACTIVATAVVAARWYTRYRLVRCIGLDDYVILLSLVSLPLGNANICSADFLEDSVLGYDRTHRR